MTTNERTQVMTPARVQEFATALEQDENNAARRVTEAEETLRLAQGECEAAKEALLQLQRQRVGFQQTFAETLGTAEPKAVDTASGRSLQLVPSLAAKTSPLRMKMLPRELVKMTAAAKLKYVLGDRFLTLDEIRSELKALEILVPNLAQVLSKSRHNVLDGSGGPQRNAKGELVKRNTFVALSRGTWRVAEPHGIEIAAAVLSRHEAQTEMLKNRRSAT
jgi:hypothetical protein